jgi:hypothetical protein
LFVMAGIAIRKVRCYSGSTPAGHGPTFDSPATLAISGPIKKLFRIVCPAESVSNPFSGVAIRMGTSRKSS